MKTKVRINKSKIKEAYEMLQAMDTNWPIIKMIAEHPGSSVTELIILMRTMVQSDVSFRLMRLRSFELVEGKRSGKEIHYYITPKALKVASKINKYVKDKG